MDQSAPCENRRRFLQLGLAGALSIAATPALALGRIQQPRRLALHNLHTDERLDVTYWKDGQYGRGAIAKLNNILRDHRSGDVAQMNLGLFDLLHDLQNKMHHDGRVEIISGYRSPRTNAMLANLSDGVATHSYHTKAMAMDIRIPGRTLRSVQNAALLMRRGGVGFYPSSDFVHIDVGPVRRW